MFDSVQAGWLAGDDYRRAVEAAGVVELPRSGEPAEVAEATVAAPAQPDPDPEQDPERETEPGRDCEGSARPAAAPTRMVDLPRLLADAPPEVLGRTVLAVATMHEPDPDGRCRACQPGERRWWRRSRRRFGNYPCPTRRMLLAGVSTPYPARSVKVG